MKPSLVTDGYAIHRSLVDASAIENLKEEADRVAQAAGSVCVRHLRGRSALFDALCVSELFLSLLPEGLRPVRSILFDKTEAENWPVLWHQDLTIAVTERREVSGYGPWSEKDGVPHVQPPVKLLQNMVTLRVHLDDTPATNGALQVIPQSHQKGRIDAEMLRTYDKGKAVTCACGPGDVLLMSPLILHASRRSEVPARRRVIHLEYAREDDLDSELQWFDPVN